MGTWGGSWPGARVAREAKKEPVGALLRTPLDLNTCLDAEKIYKYKYYNCFFLSERPVLLLYQVKINNVQSNTTQTILGFSSRSEQVLRVILYLGTIESRV